MPRTSLTSPVTPGVTDMDSRPSTDYDKEGKEGKDGRSKDRDKDKTPGTPFSRKFGMKNPFGRKRSVSQASDKPPTTPGPAPESAADDKAEESESSAGHDADLAHSFLGLIRRIRTNYDRLVIERPGKHVESRIAPSAPSETPVLQISPNVKIFIQEETSAGGLVNIYQGTVGTVGQDEDVDAIEKTGTLWLAEVLLQNVMPAKDNIKVTFYLLPGTGMPVIAGPDSEAPQQPDSKLNANRVLRVRKILMYIAERLEKDTEPKSATESKQVGGTAEVQTHPKVEDDVELYCNDKVRDIEKGLYDGECDAD